MPQRPYSNLACGQGPQQRSRVVQGGGLNDGPEVIGIQRHREEGPREQKERKHDQGHDLLERRDLFGYAGEDHGSCRKRAAREHHRRQCKQSPGRMDQPEGQHDDQEARSIDRAADQGPSDLADSDIGDVDRCRDDPVVGPHPIELEERTEESVEESTVERRRCEHPGSEERGVVELTTTVGDPADELSHPEADRNEIEDGFEESADERDPVMLVREGVPIHDLARTVKRWPGIRCGAFDDGHQGISLFSKLRTPTTSPTQSSARR